MVFKKTVMNSISWAAMGFALTGAAYGQEVPNITAPGATTPGVAEPGITDGTITRNGNLNADAAIDAQAPDVDVESSAAGNANRNRVNTDAGAQINRVQADADGTVRTPGQNNDSTINSNVNAGANGAQNRANISQNSRGSANLNPFGATFDTNSTDRLIIQNLQPNSVASRLGLLAGDRIIDVNGRTYTNGGQFDQDLATWNSNTDIPITYERNGQRYTRNFRLGQNNVQQTYNGSINGNQGFNNQSYHSQQSYSADRPSYDVAGNSSNYSGMSSNQGCGPVGYGTVGYGTVAYGNDFNQGQDCCGGSGYIEQSYGYGGRHGRHHGGRRNRHCCQ